MVKLAAISLVASSIVFGNCSAFAVQPDAPAILFSSIDPATRDRKIVRVSADGEHLSDLARVTKNDGYPAASLDGGRVAFYGKYDDRKTWSIHSAVIGESEAQRLTHVENVWDSSPAWSFDGAQIVFSREYEDAEKVWREEIWTMTADGEDQRQVEGLVGGGASFLEDGRILYHSGAGTSEICIASADGKEVLQLTENTFEDIYPVMSPDGKKIAFMSDRDGNREIYVMNIDGSKVNRLTFNEGQDWNPAWSPDGKKLVFASENATGTYDIYTMNSDGSSLKKVAESGIQPAWIPN